MEKGHDNSDNAYHCWDVVVITAIDDAQKLAYETQLNKKLKTGQIPKSILYRVYSDWPPGVKIGTK